MDGKIIFMFMIMVNVLSLMFASSCVGIDSKCQLTNNVILPTFFDISENVDMTEPYGLSVNESFENQSSAMLTPQAAGAKVTEGFSLFLDSLRMVLGILSLLTPLPFLDLLNGFGMPLFVLLPLGAFVFIGWFLAIVELLRGGAIGK